MKFEIDTDAHHGIGPYKNAYGHGPVVVMNRWTDSDREDRAKGLEYAIWACLDCGYVAHDVRLFLHEECERESNPINQTWREFLSDDDYPDAAWSDSFGEE